MKRTRKIKLLTKIITTALQKQFQ